MKALGYWLCLSTLLVSISARAQVESKSSLKANLNANVAYSGLLNRPLKIDGDIRWQNVPAGKTCVFVPYNDPDFGFENSMSRHMELMGQKFTRQLFLGAKSDITFTTSNLHAQQLAPYLWSIDIPQGSGDVAIAFSSSVPWLANGDNEDWFYEGFYPQILQECPSLSTRTLFYQKPAEVEFAAKVSHPEGWELAANTQIKAPEFVFALVRGYKKLAFNYAGVQINILFNSDSFLQLLPTIEGALKSHTDLFGAYPFPQLWIVETSELQRATLPGLIAINRPRQAAFKLLQSKFLNWAHWNVVTLLANQWFGASVQAHNPDYFWLIAGVSDFATLEALRANNKRYNLMNVYDVGYFGVSLNYLQVQDLTAALLNRAEPFIKLTNGELQAATPFVRQHPLLFIKQSIALRHLSGAAGSENFAKFLKNFFKDHAFTKIKPENFLAAMQKLPSPFSPQKRAELNQVLQSWYQTPGWPDYAIEDFASEKLADGRWIAKVDVSSRTGFHFATPIQVTDRDGQTYRATAMNSAERPDHYTAQVLVRSQPESLMVDADHYYFDQDRFNNRTGWPSVHFFPGSADSFGDDSYTVVWLPYPFRRPGESFAIGLQTAIFRYLSGNVFLKIESEVDDGDTAFLLRNSQMFPRWATQLDLSAEQTLQGYRVAEAALTRSSIFDWHQNLSLGVGLRHKQVAGIKDSVHQTVLGKFALKPTARYDFCYYNLTGEYERAPKQSHTDFTYDRRHATLLGVCDVAGMADLSLRFFRGELTATGTPSADAYFDVQNLGEARLRLDMPDLTDVAKIATASVDLSLPLMVPLPNNAMVLNRKTKWRLFYDFGRALDLETNYRATGAGFLIPFGGDLSGAGSVTLTQVSLLAVLYSEAENKVSRDVRILFDVSGEL